MNDYGPKKAAYAAAAVPVYLIADPYTRRCVLHTLPTEGEYTEERHFAFGEPVDMTDTHLELILATDEFLTD